MRILIPLDGSPLAENALKPAVLFAKHNHPNAEIILVRVVRYPVVDGGLAGAYPEIRVDNLQDIAQEYLHSIVHSTLFHGLHVRAITQMGGPAQVICATAQHEKADLIIMASHGRVGFGKWMMGSVAEMVARDAHIPVLIVQPQGEVFPDIGRFTTLTILVPLDGTSLSEAAIEPAAMLARAFNGTLALVRILPESTDNTAVAQEAYAYLTTFHDRLITEGVSVDRSLGWGDPAEQIVAKAVEHHADMVAIATHARMPLAQLMQGSVAFAVLHQLTMPVLIVHPIRETATITAE